jgi:hypothetical protein
VRAGINLAPTVLFVGEGFIPSLLRIPTWWNFQRVLEGFSTGNEIMVDG